MKSRKSLDQWFSSKGAGALGLAVLAFFSAKMMWSAGKQNPDRYRDADIFTPAEKFLKEATTNAALKIFNDAEACHQWTTNLADLIASSATNAYSISILKSQSGDIPPKMATICPMGSMDENASTQTVCMRLTPKSTLLDTFTGSSLDIFAAVTLSFWDPIGHQSATCQQFEKLPIRPIQASFTVYWRAKGNSEHEFFSKTSAGTVLAPRKKP